MRSLNEAMMKFIKMRWSHIFSLGLLTPCLFVLMNMGASAASVAEKGSTSPKPIKVSELNANLFSAVYDFLQKIGHNVCEGFISLKDFIEVGEWVFASLKTPEMRGHVGSFCLRLTISLVLAFTLAQGLSLWLKPKIHALLKCKKGSFVHKLPRLLGATALSMVAPLMFGFSLYTLARLITPHDDVALEAARILSSGAFISWSLLNIANLFLRPPTADHQHIPLSRKSLTNAYKWIRRMALVALVGFFAFETGQLICLPSSGERLLLQGSSFVIAVMAICMMFGLQPDIRGWLQKQREKPRLSALRKAMLFYLQYSYIPVIIFIVISYISWVTPEMDAFQRIMWKVLLTLAIFPFLRVLTYCLRKIRILCFQRHIHHLSRSATREALFYTRKIDVIIQFILNIGAILFILNLWDLNPAPLIFSHVGAIIAQKVFSVFSIVVISIFIVRLINGLLTRYLRVAEGNVTDEQKQRMARFKTISSVTRNVVRIAIWTPAIYFILIEVDIDPFPILGTVGVLAIGLTLGVQSLVKDVATGFFMLLEDAFAVGDLVFINEQEGRIESLTIRVVRLRSTDDGSIHTFPYGNITSLANQNREFSTAVMRFQVGVLADIDQVFDIVERISKELRKTPGIRRLILGSVEIDGVDKIDDHALEIKIVFRTKPSEHYKVRRAFNKLLKQYFETENIPMATPRLLSYNYVIEK